MNVVDNLNSVKVINKPCMSSRRMSLLPRTALHSDSEQYVYIAFPIREHIFVPGFNHPVRPGPVPSGEKLVSSIKKTPVSL